MANVDNSGRWYTVQEAAQIHGCSEALVHKWRREKKIKSVKDPATSRILLNADDVDAIDSGADGLLEQTSAQLQQLFKTRNEAVQDLKLIITEQRTEMSRKDERIKELEGRVSDYHKREAENLQVIEELMTLRHQRELERLTHETNQALKKEAVEKIGPLLQVLTAKIGMKIPGAGAGAPVGALQAARKIFTSLSPEEQDQIMNVLGLERALALQMLLEPDPAKPPAKATETADGSQNAA